MLGITLGHLLRNSVAQGTEFVNSGKIFVLIERDSAFLC